MNPVRTRAPRFLRLAVLFACAAALALCAQRAHADDAPPQMSPEEAAVQLQPYILKRGNAPSGYTASSAGFASPANKAFLDTSGASPLAVVAGYEQQGFVLEMLQTLSLDGDSAIVAAPQLANFHIFVMRSDDAAQAVVATTAIPLDASWTAVQTLDGLPTLGDDSVLYDLSAGDQEAIELRWRRGATAFEVFVRAGDGGPAGVVNLAQALDEQESANPPIDLSNPQVTPPATQAERLQALLRMQTIEVPASTFPSGFMSLGPSIGTSVGAVGNAADPTQMLNLVDTKWQQIANLSQTYASLSTSTRYYVGFDEDASAAAQAIDMRDFPPSVTSPPTLEPSPVALGDDAFVIHGHTTTSGSARDYTTLTWRHGALALTVEISGKPGSLNDADVVSLAQAVDAAYLKSVYAATTRTSDPPTSAPMPAIPSAASEAVR